MKNAKTLKQNLQMPEKETSPPRDVMPSRPSALIEQLLRENPGYSREQMEKEVAEEIASLGF